MTKRSRLSVSVTLFLVCATALSLAQQSSTISQKSDKSLCSNIVALSGSLNVNCSSLTPAQQKILANLPRVLNKILTNQLDTDAIMAKLDEMARSQQGNTIVQYCTAGICNNGINNGSQTVINNKPADRHLISSQVTQLEAFAKSLPATIKLNLMAANDADSVNYATEISNALSFNLPKTAFNIALVAWQKDGYVLIHGPDAPTFSYAQQLAGILASTGTHFNFTQGAVNQNDILIYIGTQ
jgi:hypothetical protein